MITYYCVSCGHKSVTDKYRCQSCGTSNGFCSESTYGNLMISLLSHRFKDYRLDALQKIRELRYEPAIPEIKALMTRERDPIIIRESVRTLNEIVAYQERNRVEVQLESPASSHDLDISTSVSTLIEVTRIMTRQNHRKLRADYHTEQFF